MTTFEEQYCTSCGVRFGVPENFTEQRRRDEKTFYCPNGHGMSYTKAYKDSEFKRLQDEKTRSERSLQAQLNEALHAQLVAEKAAKKATADKRKVERRIAHGVCPCCNKTFADLSNHMVSEHKDFRLPSGKAPKRIEAAKNTNGVGA